MLRYLLLLLLFHVIVLATRAQSLQQGQVFENKTRIALPNIKVENTANKQTVITDKEGKFSISAKAGDVLVFKGFAYQPDTLFLTDMKFKEVFMQPEEHLLKDVTITNTEVNTKGWVDPSLKGRAVDYLRDDNGNYKGGIALRLGYFSKKKKTDKEADLKNKEAAKDEMAIVFSAKNLQQYLPLKGVELENFARMYIPSLKVYRAKDFNLLVYLNKCYKEFIQLPEEKRKTVQNIFVPVSN